MYARPYSAANATWSGNHLYCAMRKNSAKPVDTRSSRSSSVHTVSGNRLKSSRFVGAASNCCRSGSLRSRSAEVA